MVQTEKLLNEYTLVEKTAYIRAVTALATAGREASEDEQYLLEAISESAGLTENEITSLRATAMQETTDPELRQSLDILRGSELRFSLLTDLMAFAESDEDYTAAEHQHIKSVADYLGVAPEQYSVIGQFVQKAAASDARSVTAAEPQGFMESLGLQTQFGNAGMNFANISRGLLGVLLPVILRRITGSRGMGASGTLTSGSRGGGLGSLISILNGGRGMGNIGGMLSNMFNRYR